MDNLQTVAFWTSWFQHVITCVILFMPTIHILCKSWKTVFEEKLLVFQKNNSDISQKMFSEVTRPA